MRRHLFSIPFAVLTCAIGILISYGPPVENVPVADSPARSTFRQHHKPRPKMDIYGAWGGVDGDEILSLTSRSITDSVTGRTFGYDLKRITESVQGQIYLFELKGYPGGSNLRRFVSLRTNGDGSLSFSGYESLEDAIAEIPTARYNLYRIEPEKR